MVENTVEKTNPHARPSRGSGLSLPTLQERTMDDEIQLISDGDGLAVIGDPAAVRRFLVCEGLSSKDLGLPRLGAVLSTGAAVAQAGSEIAANSGRWVKLTRESAQLASKYGLRKSSETGLSTGVLKGEQRPGQGIRPIREGAWIASDQPGASSWCRGDHGAACDAAGHGRDRRLSRHDRRESR